MDLAAQRLPAAAERIVLAQVAAVAGFGQHVEEAVVRPRLGRGVARRIGRVAQVGPGLGQALEHRARDQHESRGRVQHLDEAVGVGRAHAVSCVGRKARMPRLEVGARAARGQGLVQPLGGPAVLLERIDAGHHVAAGQQQPQRRRGLEADVGIDPEQMRPARVGHELGHQPVARARDQAVAVQEPRLHREAVAPGEVHQPQQAAHVDRGQRAAVARGGDEGADVFQCGNVEHRMSPFGRLGRLRPRGAFRQVRPRAAVWKAARAAWRGPPAW